jgi:hypothetical protein
MHADEMSVGQFTRAGLLECVFLSGHYSCL